MTDRQDLRRKVLNASVALIAEGGLEGLSLREVARKAGVSHQAPYHHFADREAILAAIAGEGFAKLAKALDRAASAAAAKAADPLEGIGRAYIEFAMRHPAYLQVMYRADAVPLDRYPEARRQEKAAFAKLNQVVDAAFATEPPERRLRIAVGCWAMVHGLATLLLGASLACKVGVPKTKQRQFAEEVIRTCVGLLERGSA
jgi:AcrR family transcriptional regulator